VLQLRTDHLQHWPGATERYLLPGGWSSLHGDRQHAVYTGFGLLLQRRLRRGQHLHVVLVTSQMVISGRSGT
jgi:hypothetical protein